MTLQSAFREAVTFAAGFGAYALASAALQWNADRVERAIYASPVGYACIRQGDAGGMSKRQCAAGKQELK